MWENVPWGSGGDGAAAAVTPGLRRLWAHGKRTWAAAAEWAGGQ